MTGPAGPPGLQGTKGETGAQGPSGQKEERGDGTSGLMSHKNWKECAWKDLNDEKDNGLIKVIDFVECKIFLYFISDNNTQLSQAH